MKKHQPVEGKHKNPHSMGGANENDGDQPMLFPDTVPPTPTADPPKPKKTREFEDLSVPHDIERGREEVTTLTYSADDQQDQQVYRGVAAAAAGDPGAFREGGRPNAVDDDTTTFTASPESATAAPNNEDPHRVVSAHVVQEPDIVSAIAMPADQARWWSKRRNRMMLIGGALAVVTGLVVTLAVVLSGSDNPPATSPPSMILPNATSPPTVSPTETSTPMTGSPTPPSTVSPTSPLTVQPTTTSPTASPTTLPPTPIPTVQPTTILPTPSPTLQPTTPSPTLQPTTRSPTPPPSNPLVFSQIGTDMLGDVLDDEFGESISLSADGSVLAVGAPGADDNGDRSGRVRVYARAGGGFFKLGNDLIGSRIQEFFGGSVSLSADGTMLAVGASHGGGRGTGSVQVFRLTGNSWNQIGETILGDGEWNYAGIVTMSGDGSTIAIAAPSNDDGGEVAGQVRVYGLVGNSWIKRGADIDGKAPGDRCSASSLSSDGTILAVGCPQNGGGESAPGHVRVFQFGESSWNKLGDDIVGETLNDRTGHSVSLSRNGDVIAISTPYGNGSINSARVFRLVGSTWTKIGNTVYGESGDIGKEVSLSADGSLFALGSVSRRGAENTGVVRVYELVNEDSEQWMHVGQVLKGDKDLDDYGEALSLAANAPVLAVGANQGGTLGLGPGYVRVFELGQQ